MFPLSRRRDRPSGRQSSRQTRVLVIGCLAVGAVICTSVTEALHQLLAFNVFHALPRASALSPVLEERGLAARSDAQLQSGRRQRDVSVKAKGFGSAQPSKGFAAAGASKVAEPSGGWPTLSVVLLNADSKVATSSALQQLASQDYPTDRIQEVIVLGASELSGDVPEALKPLLKEFKQAEGEQFGIEDELQACTGDYVAIWGDDHISPPSRLRTQIAAALDGEAATLLQPEWYFDPESSDFIQVRKWPTSELEDAAELELPEGFAELMVCADPLTLCGTREALTEASKGVKPSDKPTDELKDLMIRLLKARRPKVLRDVSWAAVRSPPAATQYEQATPERALVQLAEEAWPRESKGKTKSAFGKVLEDIRSSDMKPVDAIDRLLSEDVTKPLKQFDLENIRKAVAGTLAKATPGEVAASISEMLTWQGLAPGQGDRQAARNLPVFFAAFRAIRSHVAESADFYDMRSISIISESLVRLAMAMWATDARVNEVLAMILARELIPDDMREENPAKFVSAADVVGTLGLRGTLESMAYAAMDMPGEDYPVDVLVNLAWAMGQGGVENGSLQMKIAKGIMRQVDKLSPPDIGKLFIVLHEHKWFKDDNTIRYLLETMMSRVKVLKQNDPGLAKILAAR